MPRRSAVATEASRQSILRSAARLMRERGFDGVGIDAIVADAGLTPGAFYTHFESKTALFAAVVEAALTTAEEHLPPIEQLRDVRRVVAFYLNDRAVLELGTGCIVAAMSADVARQGDRVRAMAGAYIELIHQRIMQAYKPTLGRRARDNAWRLVAQTIGALIVARIFPHGAMRTTVLRAARRGAQL